MRYRANPLPLLCLTYFIICFCHATNARAANEANACISIARDNDASKTEVLLKNNCSKDVEIKWTTADGSCMKWSCASTLEAGQNYPANGARPIKFFACFKPAIPTNTKTTGWLCTTQIEKPKSVLTEQKMPALPTKKDLPVEKKKENAPEDKITPKQVDRSDTGQICRRVGNECTAACDAVYDWESRVQCVSSCIDKTNMCLSGPITGSTPK